MEARTFRGYGKEVTTSDKAEIKRMKACGWQEVKQPKQVYAKGLKEGRTFYN